MAAIDLLYVACNPLRSQRVREQAYLAYESSAWYDAVRERHFPLFAVPADHQGFVARTLIGLEVALPKSLHP